MPSPNIAEWNVTTLIKFVKEVFEKDPPLQLTNLQVEELRVLKQLTLDERMVFGGKTLVVGTNGAPAFESSWVNFTAAGGNRAAFYKDAEGFVRLSGLIQNGTVGSAAFTLPPGYRPPARVILATISNGAMGRITVESNGQVIPATPSSNAWVSLEGLFFRAL